MSEMYSEAEQTVRSSGKYMVSASIKASKFTLKQFDKLCRFIARCLSKKEGLKIGKQSLKDLMAHGNKVVEIGVDPPKPEEIAKQSEENDLTWDKGMVKGFEKYADQYGINYSILKEDVDGENRFRIFFEGKDASVVNRCLQNYLKDRMKERNKKAMKEKIHEFHEQVQERKDDIVASRTDKIKDKVPQHEER